MLDSEWLCSKYLREGYRMTSRFAQYGTKRKTPKRKWFYLISYFLTFYLSGILWSWLCFRSLLVDATLLYASVRVASVNLWPIGVRGLRKCYTSEKNPPSIKNRLYPQITIMFHRRCLLLFPLLLSLFLLPTCLLSLFGLISVHFLASSVCCPHIFALLLSVFVSLILAPSLSVHVVKPSQFKIRFKLQDWLWLSVVPSEFLPTRNLAFNGILPCGWT